LEDYALAVQELATEDIKAKTEALKQRRLDLANPTAPAAPATPTRGRYGLDEHTPTTTGIERAWSLRRAAEKPTEAEKQIVTPVVLLFENKTPDWVSKSPEKVVYELFAFQFAHLNHLVPMIIGGIARSVGTIGDGDATLAIKFFVAPHSVAQWSATFGDGTPSTTAVFIDNSTRVRLLVLGNCQL
jgi:hypothetical protein